MHYVSAACLATLQICGPFPNSNSKLNLVCLEIDKTEELSIVAAGHAPALDVVKCIFWTLQTKWHNFS